jgi:hypothetical protein
MIGLIGRYYILTETGIGYWPRSPMMSSGRHRTLANRRYTTVARCPLLGRFRVRDGHDSNPSGVPVVSNDSLATADEMIE